MKRVLVFFFFMLFEKKINAVLFCFTYTVLKSVCDIIFFQNCSLVIIALVALPTQKHLHIENSTDTVTTVTLHCAMSEAQLWCFCDHREGKNSLYLFIQELSNQSPSTSPAEPLRQQLFGWESNSIIIQSVGEDSIRLRGAHRF